MKLKYYIGTAGWSYKDWVPSFYPKNQSRTQVRFQQFAAGSCPEFVDGFVLDLANPLPGEAELVADVFQ